MQAPPFLSSHALERARERFPLEFDALSLRESHDTIQRCLAAGVPWGASAGSDRHYLATLPKTGAQVIIAVGRTAAGAMNIKTLLTMEQALANQQVTFRGKWQPNYQGAQHKPRSRRR